MTGLPDAFKLVPISSGAGDGYAVYFHGDAVVTFCAVVADSDGNVTCAKATAVEAEHLDPAREVDHSPEDKKSDVPWAFSLMAGGPVDKLLDELSVPLAMRDGISKDVAKAVEQAAALYLPSVKLEALDAMRKSPVRTLAALSYYSAAGERGARRRQAAASYPVLAGLLSTNLSVKMAIDTGKPLADPLAKVLGGFADRPVSKPVLKRTAASEELPDGTSLETVVAFMTLVPHDWIPSGGNEWRAFCTAAHALLEDLRCREEDVLSLVKGCSGKWTEFCARIAKRGGFADGDVLRAARQAMFGAAEMIDIFAEAVVIPLAAHAGESDSVSLTPEMMQVARRSALQLLVSGRNAADVADLQRRWHQEKAAILSATAIMEEERISRIRGQISGEWPLLTSPVQAPNGLWLVPLGSSKELAWEGLEGEDPNGVPGLQHCVGTYDSKARKLDCHIVSVRTMDDDGSYERLSTVEFAGVKSDSNRLKILQHQGRGNSNPESRAHDAVSWYMASCAHGLIKINHEQMSVFLDNIPVPDDGVERVCGYDWRDRSILNTAAGPWAPFVVPGFRRPLDALMEMEEIRSITDLISPEIVALRR